MHGETWTQRRERRGKEIEIEMENSKDTERHRARCRKAEIPPVRRGRRRGGTKREAHPETEKQQRIERQGKQNRGRERAGPPSTQGAQFQ